MDRHPDLDRRKHLSGSSGTGKLRGILEAVKLPSTKERARVWHLVALALILLFVALSWPFGLKVSGTYDEWTFMQRADSGGSFIHQPTRPLLALPYVIAHAITPGSFVGLNLVQVAILIAKGLMAYVVTSRIIRGRQALAFTTAVLFVVYPSDAGVLQLRSTPTHASVLCYLVAVYFLLLACDRLRWSAVVAFMAAQAAAIALYDSGIALMLFTPVLILLITERRLRDLRSVLAVWCIVPGLGLAGLLIAARMTGSYHSQILVIQGPGALFQESIRQVQRVYLQHFMYGWLQAVEVFASKSYVFSALLIATLLGILLFLVMRRDGSEREAGRRTLRVAGWSFGAVLMGFVMYIPTAVRNDSFRVFLFSSWGAALVVAIVVHVVGSLFGRWANTVIVLAVSTLIAVSAVRAYNDFHAVEEDGLRQQRVMAGIVKQAPKISSGATLLLIDREPHQVYRAFSACARPSTCIQQHLRYLYAQPNLDVLVCWAGDSPMGKLGEACRFGAGGAGGVYTDRYTGKQIRVTYPYRSLIVFEGSERGLVLLENLRRYVSPVRRTYDPSNLIDKGAALPDRVHSLFTRWPLSAAPPQPKTVDTLSIDFDSLRDFASYGWSTPEGSRTWTNRTRAVIDTHLKSDRDYVMRFRVIRGITADVLSSLRVTVNGSRIELSKRHDREGATILTGNVRSETVASDTHKTRLSFNVSRVVTPVSIGMSTTDNRTLGVYFDWLRITPWRD